MLIAVVTSEGLLEEVEGSGSRLAGLGCSSLGPVVHLGPLGGNLLSSEGTQARTAAKVRWGGGEQGTVTNAGEVELFKLGEDGVEPENSLVAQWSIFDKFMAKEGGHRMEEGRPGF